MPNTSNALNDQDMIELLRSGPIGEIRFNRPQQKNAAGTALWRELANAVSVFESDKDVSVIIIHGGPNASFCAGADISEFPEVFETDESTGRYLDIMEAALGGIEGCTKPVIGAIEGFCIGAGVAIASACDIRICSSDIRFGVTPANLGLVYSYPDLARLTRLLGSDNAKHVLLTGELFDAEDARRMGFSSRISHAGAAYQDATDLALKMATKSQTSIRTLKTMIGKIVSADADAAAFGRRAFTDSVAGADFAEGVKAFSEKRRAEFPSVLKTDQ